MITLKKNGEIKQEQVSKRRQGKNKKKKKKTKPNQVSSKNGDQKDNN